MKMSFGRVKALAAMPVLYSDGGTGVRDLAYVSATTGYLVHVSDSPALAYGLGLMKTANAGKTWTTVKIP